LGRRIQKGLSEAPVMTAEGKIEVVKVALKVDSIEGFSGHSDRKQIVAYIQRLTQRPEKLIVCHGEKAKSISIANLFQRKYKVDAMVPAALETIRLR